MNLKNKSKKAKIIIIAVLVVAIVVLSIFGVRYYISKSGASAGTNAPGQMNGNGGSMNTITASGTSTLGMVEETFDVQNLENDLEVEEVYVSSGDTVKEGDKLLKISEDSLNSARTECEQAAKDAEYAYRLGVISTQEELISAKTTLDSAAVSSKYAQNEYDNSIQDSKDKVSDLEDQIDEKQDLIDEYTKAADENYYYTYYDVANLKKKASEDFTLLMKLYDDWNIADQESETSTTGSSTTAAADYVQNSGSSSTAADSGTNGSETTGTSSGSTTSSHSSISNTQLSVYNAFSDLVDEESADYEEAQENYESATKTAKASLNKEKAALTKLQSQLTQAKAAYNTACAEAKSTYNETIAAADTAQETYDTSVDKINDELDTLKDACDDADDNLQEFEAAVNDGYMYASTDGTIMMVGVEEGDTLTSDSMVVAYTDDSSISVAASVDQSYISQISLGESATVVFDEEGTFEGTVVSIDPVTQSSSKSSVSYTVTVLLSGDVSSLSHNLAATVTFAGSDESQTGMSDAGTEKSVTDDAETDGSGMADEAGTAGSEEQ